jgi:pyruvate/2-oxoglutarate dehydrogenase complex dihydrolipoamide acyltransferase (E2) component
MSLVEVQVPDIGDFDEVAVIELLVKVGDTVKAEQSLITVESDKASMEIPSSTAGVVKELRVALGDKVKEGSVVLVVEAAVATASAAPAAPAMAEDDDMDEMYDMDEEDMEEMYEEMEDDSELEEETVFHVNESMLRKELRRLKESKKGIKDAMADQFGGGKEEGDPWLDGDVTTESVDENDAEEIAEKALKVAKKATDAAKDEREKRKEEARANRGLKGKLDESSKMIAALREQLDEVNLFNAKLLYVNKLMQNRDLTPRQQRSIVESLDGAKSVREAQLLFNSLTESLKVKSTKMNEGKVFGSASRSTRSGSAPAALNESVEVDRWAILAGIKK